MSKSLILVRPFRVRLSMLDLRTSQSTNTNEISTNSSSPTSTRRLPLKLNEYFQDKSKSSSSNISLNERDEHDREIIQRFVNAKNEIDARKILSQMWKESRFCDLMLVVDGSEYLAHRIVLAAFSPKYRNFFRERRSDFVTRTHLRHTTHKGLQLVLIFLYSGELTLTFRNVNEILQCAKELDIGKIFDIAEEFLSTFDKRHVFRVFEISRRFALKKSFYQSHLYLSKNFNQCISMKHFLQLPYTTIGQILADETIENRDESIVFSRILNWITTNHVDNHQIILHLFQRIRWNHLNFHQQREWLTASQELAENPKLSSFIREQMTLAYDKSKRRSSSVSASTTLRKKENRSSIEMK